MKTWLVRKSILIGRVPKSHADRKKCRAELIYGVQNGEKIKGAVHHVLTGPNAVFLLERFAATLNAAQYCPPKRAAKTRADGFTNKTKPGEEVIL